MKNVLLLLAATLTCALAMQAESGYRVTARYPVSGTGGWDYITFDGGLHRLFVAHSTQVNVLDSDTGKEVGVVPDTPGVHGIAVARELKRAFTSNGKEDKVSIFDPETLNVIGKVDVGKGPDGIYLHRATLRVFTCNHGSHDITAIDAQSGKVVGTVALQGDGEQMTAGQDNTIWVNVEDTSEVVSFDAMTLKVLKRFKIEGATTPTGLVYDRKHDRIITSCRSKSMVVMNGWTGKKIRSYPIGAGVDASAWDIDTGLIYVSTGEGVLNIFHQKSADDYEDLGAVKTQPSAKTMALDKKNKRVFLPAAEMIETPAAEPGGRPTRTVKEGSFVVLVVSK